MQEIIDYYANLLIIQYNDKPKAKATIALFVKELLADGVMLSVRDGYKIENAVGKQLDILGKWVGIDRFYKGQNFNFANNYFGFTNYNNSDNGQEGFTTFALFETKQGEFLTNSEIASNNQRLGDDDFRLLLKLKIVCNNINYSQYSIDKALFDSFGNDLILSTLNDLKISYFASDNVYGIINVMLQKNLLPKPMAIRIESVIATTNPLFSFISYNENVAEVNNDSLRIGFSTYTNGVFGETLNYNKLLDAI